MAHGKRESNGKRPRSVEARPKRVTRGEDREDEHEGDEHLNTEDLSVRHSIVRSRRTQKFVCFVHWESFQDCGAGDCTQGLHYDVQQRSAALNKTPATSPKSSGVTNLFKVRTERRDWTELKWHNVSVQFSSVQLTASLCTRLNNATLRHFVVSSLFFVRHLRDLFVWPSVCLSAATVQYWVSGSPWRPQINRKLADHFRSQQLLKLVTADQSMALQITADP